MFHLLAALVLGALRASAFGPLPVRPEAILNVTPGVYNIKNVKSGKYLNVRGSSKEEGAQIWLWDDPNSSSSQWHIEHVVNYGAVSIPGDLGVPGIYFVRNVYSDKRLSVQSGSVEDMKEAVQSANADMASQWMIQDVGCGSNCFAFQDAKSGKWLNVQGGGVDDGTPVWQFHSNLQNDSWWILEPPACVPEWQHCDLYNNNCCAMGNNASRQMTCFLGHDVPAACYDTSKCTTYICDLLSCCAGWTCVPLGPISRCEKKEEVKFV
mmetsp:Transcript_6889/g.12185  ORF Transcript_6889/g.12185 Transcript_6889/m.12185 type:complete len:266 (+) Transcript_6889:77-874(+)